MMIRRLTALLVLLPVWNAEAEIAQLPFPQCEAPTACAMRSVVSLLPQWPQGFSRNEEPEGSGIVLGDGKLIATANHVLGPAKSAKVRTLSGEIIDAKIVMRDPATDIALLAIPQTLPVFQLAEGAKISQSACAIGNSFGLDISIACGVVSAVQLSGTGFNRIEDFIQTDASVNPGMSGGALVNENGELLGMLSAIFTRQSDANIGVNFAASAELLIRVLDDFRSDGSIEHRLPGLLVRPSKPENSNGMVGAEVRRVIAGSPEDRAGITLGDVILYAGQRRISRAGAYEAAIMLAQPAEALTLRVLRGTKIMNVTVEID